MHTPTRSTAAAAASCLPPPHRGCGGELSPWPEAARLPARSHLRRDTASDAARHLRAGRRAKHRRHLAREPRSGTWPSTGCGGPRTPSCSTTSGARRRAPPSRRRRRLRIAHDQRADGRDDPARPDRSRRPGRQRVGGCRPRPPVGRSTPLAPPARRRGSRPAGTGTVTVRPPLAAGGSRPRGARAAGTGGGLGLDAVSRPAGCGHTDVSGRPCSLVRIARHRLLARSDSGLLSEASSGPARPGGDVAPDDEDPSRPIGLAARLRPCPTTTESDTPLIERAGHFTQLLTSCSLVPDKLYCAGWAIDASVELDSLSTSATASTWSESQAKADSSSTRACSRTTSQLGLQEQPLGELSRVRGTPWISMGARRSSIFAIRCPRLRHHSSTLVVGKEDGSARYVLTGYVGGIDIVAGAWQHPCTTAPQWPTCR